MNGTLRSIVKPLRNNDLVWRYGFNILPSLGYTFGGESGLSHTERSVLKNLNRDGVAITDVDALFNDTSEFDRLESQVGDLIQSRKEEMNQLRARANSVASVGEKTFNTELLESVLTVDPMDHFCRFALNSSFLNVANAYLRMYAKLRYYNVWYTFASSGEARESQLWHFDREDNYILKVFVYLRDVYDGAGPFTYAPQTHRKGAFWNRLPEAHFENNVRRSTDEQMHAVVPREKWIRATGKKGTIIFADTRGYHKGGEARSDDRLMFTCMFTSPTSDSKELLKYRETNSYETFNRKQRRAIRSR